MSDGTHCINRGKNKPTYDWNLFLMPMLYELLIAFLFFVLLYFYMYVCLFVKVPECYLYYYIIIKKREIKINVQKYNETQIII